MIRPPEDQANVPRLGVSFASLSQAALCADLSLPSQLFYFSRAAWDYPANAIAPSPVLERLGIYKPDEEQKESISGLEFTRARVKHSWDRVRYGDEEFREGFKHKGIEIRTDYE